MHKREITYETLDDPPKTITEVHYFHLTVPEFALMNPDIDPDTDPDDIKLVDIVVRTEDIILNSYGRRLEDGSGFEKSKKLRKKFKDSLAYLALADELFGDDVALNEFVRLVLPSKLSAGLEKVTAMQEEGKSSKEIIEAMKGPTPPAPPKPPTS